MAQNVLQFDKFHASDKPKVVKFTRDATYSLKVETIQTSPDSSGIAARSQAEIQGTFKVPCISIKPQQ